MVKYLLTVAMCLLVVGCSENRIGTPILTGQDTDMVARVAWKRMASAACSGQMDTRK